MLLGHSHYTVHLSVDHVVKSGPANDQRLLRSAEMQRQFTSATGVRAPRVRFSGVHREHTVVEMDYVAGNHLFELQDPLPALERVLDYVDESFAKAKNTAVSATVFQNKICSVEASLGDKAPEFRDVFTSLRRVFSSDLELPVGPCHGDLTFCNVIVLAPDDVWLIDFSDSIVQSPLVDAVKLRQDTLHGWIKLLDTRVTWEQLEQADAVVWDRLCQHAAVRTHFPKFDLLSLVRILPYVRDAVIWDHLTKEVARAHADLDLRGF